MHSPCFDKHSYRRLGAGDIAGACEIMKNSLLSLPVTLRFFSSVFLPSRFLVVLFTYLLVSRFYPYSVRYGLFRCLVFQSPATPPRNPDFSLSPSNDRQPAPGLTLSPKTIISFRIIIQVLDIACTAAI